MKTTNGNVFPRKNSKRPAIHSRKAPNHMLAVLRHVLVNAQAVGQLPDVLTLWQQHHLPSLSIPSMHKKVGEEQHRNPRLRLEWDYRMSFVDLRWHFSLDPGKDFRTVRETMWSFVWGRHLKCISTTMWTIELERRTCSISNVRLACDSFVHVIVVMCVSHVGRVVFSRWIQVLVVIDEWMHDNINVGKTRFSRYMYITI